eukprot:jgi/Ulvmu1/8221/UM041_0030.1
MGWTTNSFFIFHGLQHWTSDAFVSASNSFDDNLLSIDLRGRVVVVTGANQGLGLGISHALAQRGCTLYMVCRDEDLGKVAVKAVQCASGNKDVNLRICNLASLFAIRTLANEFCSKNIRVYLLIHNAGVMVHSERVSSDGFELSFAVNTLAPFALTMLLRDCLSSGGPKSKVIIVSSAGAYTAPLVVDGMGHPPADVDGTTRYAHDKRRQIAMAERFAVEFAENEIQVYTCHPGWVDTAGLRHSAPGFYKTFQAQLRSVEQGADTVVFLALCPAEHLTNGAFYFDRMPQIKHYFWLGTEYSKSAADYMWECLSAAAKL